MEDLELRSREGCRNMIIAVILSIIAWGVSGRIAFDLLNPHTIGQIAFTVLVWHVIAAVANLYIWYKFKPLIEKE